MQIGALLIAVVAFTACGDGTSRRIEYVRATDNRHSAYLIPRNMSAPHRLPLLNVRWMESGTTLVVAVDESKETVMTSSCRNDQFTLRWRDNNTLQVTAHACGDKNMQKSPGPHNDLNVVYITQ